MTKKRKYVISKKDNARTAERALLRRALGFTTTEVTTKKIRRGRVQVTKTYRYVPPDVEAIALFLNHYAPDRWPLTLKECTRGLIR